MRTSRPNLCDVNCTSVEQGKECAINPFRQVGGLPVSWLLIGGRIERVERNSIAKVFERYHLKRTLRELQAEVSKPCYKLEEYSFQKESISKSYDTRSCDLCSHFCSLCFI